jgi:outer membrane protein assembly factor BamD
MQHQELIVLKYGLDRYRLGRITQVRLQDHIQPNDLAAPDTVLGTPRRPVNQDTASLDPALDPAAGEFRHQVRQGLIQAQTRMVLTHPQVPPYMGEPQPAHGHRPLPVTSGILPRFSDEYTGHMIRTIARVAALALATTLVGCSFFGKEFDETEGWSASKLYAEAASEMDSGGYTRAIELYEKLEARYPFGRYAMQAQLDVAYAHYKADQPDEAIAAADRFIKLYPQNPYVDYAYYLKGIVNYNRSVGFLDKYIPTDPSQRDPGAALDAFSDFSELVQRFPNSKYSEDARQRMVYLRNNLAQHEVNVGRYYIKRGAYIAAANRANYVIERFQRTPAVQGALEVLVEAYRGLGDDKLAADAQQVLEVNRKAGRFVSDAPPPGEVSLSRKFWDYLSLDRN